MLQKATGFPVADRDDDEMVLHIIGCLSVDVDFVATVRAPSIDELKALLGDAVFARPILDTVVLILSIGMHRVLANAEEQLVVSLNAIDDAIESMLAITLIQDSFDYHEGVLLRVHFDEMLAVHQRIRKVARLEGHTQHVIDDDGGAKRIVFHRQVLLEIDRTRDCHESCRIG